MAKEANKKEPGETLAQSAGPSAATQEMIEAYRTFLNSVGQVDKSLVELYLEAQAKASAAYAEYALKAQRDWSKPDAVSEAFKSYSAAINDIQSKFQAKWTELAGQVAKGRTSSYREFVRKIHSSWNSIPVDKLTPAEAMNIGQLLLGVATVSQMIGGAK